MPDRLPDWAVRLDTGWAMACTPPGAAADPGGLGEDLAWWPAPVPGTAAQALQAAGVWRAEDPAPLHDQDTWYRLHLPALGPGRLHMQGLATVTELWVDGALQLQSRSMFQSHAVPLDLPRPAWMFLCFRSLDGALAEQAGGQPRARWRTRLVADRRPRLLRTTLLGHLPDWCPAIHAVGPWRPVAFVPDRPPPGPAVLSHRLLPRWDGVDGWVEARVQVLGATAGSVAALQVGDAAPVPLDWVEAGVAAGTVRVRQPPPWWPHTHGTPALHAVTLHLDGALLPLGRTGFRSIEAVEGLQLRVNGVAVFCRGASWLTPDLVGLGGSRDAVAARLRLACGAGLNMLRVPGVAHYQDEAFHDLCDELGLMVWQDLMFASMDYPTRDPAFAAAAVAEVEWALGHLSASPSLVVVCGGSEVAQQAAMMGLPDAAWRDPFYTEVLPAAVAQACPGVPWVPNSPWAEEGWPFAPAGGAPAHYFGVGAYRRPLDDAQASGVRFASECLAFSHVPCARTLDDGLPGASLHGPRWKAAVPRDPGAPWDFEDIRDHYTRLLFGADPSVTRMDDPARYLMLARATASEVLEEVVAGWRWPGSANGALVWHFADFVPGAGWGIVDAYGRPKAAWHGLRRASAPLRLILRDAGLNGLAACAVNDGPEPRALVLRLRCLRNGLVPVASADVPVQVPAHGAAVVPPATLLPRFFDITYAYRFGPPEHDVTVAWLEDASTGEVAAAAHHFPRGRAAMANCGLQAAVVQDADGWWLKAEADRFALCVHLQDPHWSAADDWFHLPPGQPRRIRLHPYDLAPPGPPQGWLCALNVPQPAAYRGAA